MKKLIALIALTTLFLAGLSAAESPIYVKTATVAKVFSHENGYKVIYLTNKFESRVLYIPMEWMYQTAGYRTDEGGMKAEIVRGTGAAYPYIQFVWKNGVFHHLRLFVVDKYSDPSWGAVVDSKALGAMFDPKKDPDLKF